MLDAESNGYKVHVGANTITVRNINGDIVWKSLVYVGMDINILDMNVTNDSVIFIYNKKLVYITTTDILIRNIHYPNVKVSKDNIEYSIRDLNTGVWNTYTIINRTTTDGLKNGEN